jgi:two-component system, NarL family, response regulator NreC
MEEITVLIADDHAIVREGLTKLLNTQEDIEIIGEAYDGLDAIEKVKQLRPDVLVLDISMPRMNGINAVRLIREEAPGTQIVILSMHDKESYAKQVLNAGAQAYVLKGAHSSELLEAIRAAKSGRFYLSHDIQSGMIDAYLAKPRKDTEADSFALLSKRERQVFQLIVDGQSSSKISSILCVSLKTVEKHRANIIRKIGISNPIDMVRYAVKIGVVDPELWRN